MYIREVHNCKTTFVNGIHPMTKVTPVVPLVESKRRSTRPATRDKILAYLQRNPCTSAHVIAIYMNMSKSNCVEQLRKMALLNLVKKELSVNPLNGLTTYFYEII